MNIAAPNVANLVRGGAIILFDRDSLGTYFDLGNIPTFSLSTPTQFVEHKTARSGSIVMDRREPTEFSNLYKFASDELNAKNLELLLNASAAGAFSQSSGSVTITLTNPTPGATYDIGAYRVSSVTLTRGTATLSPSTDYALEADLGAIRILPTGSILSTDTLTLTAAKPAVAGDRLTPLSKLTSIQGKCIAYFRTSDGRLWVRKHTLVQLSFNGETAFAGSEFAKADGELLFMPDYATPAAPFGTLDLLPAA